MGTFAVSQASGNSPPTWSPRNYHGSVALADGSIVLMGGQDNDGNAKNDVWRSIDKGATWMPMTLNAKWTPREGFASVALADGSFLVMGGSTDSGDMNDVWRSTDKGTTWTQITESAGWPGRYEFSCVVSGDGSIVLMGGQDNSFGGRNDVWRSTDNGATWTEMNASAGWSARWGHTSVALADGSIVVMGGEVNSGFANDVWRSTDDGATWTEMNASAGWSARWGHTSVALADGSIVLMGGEVNSGHALNDVWRSTDHGETWTEMTANAGWPARSIYSSVAMPDGSIVLMGGCNPEPTLAFFNDVWRSTNNGTTWTQRIAAPIPQDIGLITGTEIDSSVNGDWLNSSETVMVTTPGFSNPTLAVLTLGNPGQVPSVETNLIWLNVGSNGVVNGVNLYGQENGITSGPYPYTNTTLKGLRAAEVDDLIYAFYSLDPTHLAVSTISIAPGPSSSNTIAAKVNLLNTQKVSYISEGNRMSTFRVLGSTDGIYLVSKQVSSQGDPVLDISFIPIGELGSGGISSISPQPVMQVMNSANFNPVPDNYLYSTLLSNYPTTGNPVIVGVSDSQGQVYSWYIDLTDAGAHGQTAMPIARSTLNSVSLSQGSTSYNPAGVNDLVAAAYSSTGSVAGNQGGLYNISLGQIGSTGSVWNTVYLQSNLGSPYFGNPSLSVNNPLCLVPQGNGAMRQSMVFSAIHLVGYQYPGIPLYYDGFIDLSVLGSNTLVPDPAKGNFDTVSNFSAYGNLAIPVGIIDGVPPISLNGWPCDDFPVNSEVDLVSTSTQSTETSGTTGTGQSVKAGFNILDDKVGVSATYTEGATQTTTTGTSYSNTVTDNFPLHTQAPGSSDAYMIYLAPNLETQHFWVRDYNGNPPVPGEAMDIYVTYPSPASPYTQLIASYPITDPPTMGPLTSAMQSPMYDDFSQWDWPSWSGGWTNRDWSSYAGSGNYTVNPFGSDLDYNNGASQTTTLEMTNTVSSSHESTNTVSTDVKIFGFGGSGDVSFTQDQTVSNNIDKGVVFNWVLKEPASGTCGYSTLIVEPVILTAHTNSPLPWVPPAYQNYQPWLITYNVVAAEPNSYCLGAAPGAARVSTAVVPAGSGITQMDPADPQKGGLVHLNATPATGYAFSHWQAYGVELGDYTTDETNGIVKTDMSTIRAYFEKQQSDLVEAVHLSVGGHGTRINVSGILPASLTPGVAVDPKIPVKVIVGGKEFPFGQKVGAVEVLSDNEISFTTNNTPGGHSTLRLDYSRNTWIFTGDNAGQVAGTVPAGHTVRLGITAKNLEAFEELPLTGSESFQWTGGSETVENPLFSFDATTRIIGSFSYPCQDPGRDSFILQGARFNTSAFSPDETVRFTVNRLKFEFENATARNGDQYSFERTSNDCNVSLVFDTGAGTWAAILTGPRLSNNYWGDTQAVGLQMGSQSAQGTFTTDRSGVFSWPAQQSPLTAAFTGTPVKGAAPLSVTFTDQSEGSPTSWLWLFGDGSTSSEKNPAHGYSVPGKYSVFLLVKNQSDTSSLLMQDYVTATESTFLADFTASTTSGHAPLSVQFTDNSTGDVTTRFWDFGDRTTAWANETLTAPHTYSFPGTFTVTLTVGNIGGQETVTKTGYIQVNPSGRPPAVRFSAMPALGSAPMVVRFTDCSSGTPTAWNWDFGDGNSSSEQNPGHIYPASGRFRVTLTAFNSGGSGSFASYVWVRPGGGYPTPTITPKPPIPPIRERVPVAFFRTNQSFGSAPMSVQFTDLSFHNPERWLWQFGDGQTSTLESPVHTFTEPGTYSVWLTVENSIGESSTSRRVYVY